MKRFLGTTLAALALVASSAVAFAEPLQLYAGKAGGSYDAAMKRMSQTLQVQGIETQVVNTSGSEVIVQSVCQKGGLGVAQADAVARAQISGCQVDVLADYNKEGEYVVYMYPPGGKSRFRDLTQGETLATDLVGSGSDTTARNLRQYGNELKKTPAWAAIDIKNLEPLAAIAAAKQGKVHGLLLVRTTLSDPTFQIFLDQGWTFGEMWVDGLQEGFKSGSAPVYREAKEKTRSGKTWLYRLPAFYISRGVEERIQMVVLSEAYR